MIVALYISMKNEMVALPVFNERISPLLDVANRFAIYEIVDDRISQKIMVSLHDESVIQRVQKLKELGVSLIIGGAVSGFVTHVIAEKGIRLISWINGEADKVIHSYLRDDLDYAAEDTRGCGRGRRRGCRGVGSGKRGVGRENTAEENE